MPQQQQSQVVEVPYLEKGLDTIHNTINILPGFAQQLQNCQYKLNTLFLGRGGLDKLNSSSLHSTDDIKDIIKIGDYLYAAVDKYVYKVTISTGSATLIASLTGSDPYLINFNNDLIICDGTRTMRYDGSHVFAIGSHEDTITDTTGDGSANVYTTKVYTYTTDNDSCYHNFIQTTLSLKKVGNPESVTVSLAYGGSTIETETVLGTTLTTDYGYYTFDLTTPLEVPSNTAVTVTITATDTDTDNYVIVELYSAKPMWRFNGQHAPKARTGLVWDGHLILTNDADDQSKCYFSNVNLADDFYTEGLGGYISFNDDQYSECIACTLVFNNLALTGLASSEPVTTLVDTDWSISHRFVGSSESKRAFRGSLNTLYSVGENGLSITTGTDTFGDIQFSTVSGQIKDVFDGADLSTTVICYMPSTKQIFVKLNTSEVLYVFHTDGGQWTTYKFNGAVPTVFKEFDNVIYIGDSTGYIHILDDTLKEDNSSTIEYIIISGGMVLSPFADVRISAFNLSLVTNYTLTATLTLVGRMYETDFSVSIAANNEYIYDSTMEIGSSTGSVTQISDPVIQKCKVLTDTLQYQLTDITLNEALLSVGKFYLKVAGDGRNLA